MFSRLLVGRVCMRAAVVAGVRQLDVEERSRRGRSCPFRDRERAVERPVPAHHRRRRRRERAAAVRRDPGRELGDDHGWVAGWSRGVLRRRGADHLRHDHPDDAGDLAGEPRRRPSRRAGPSTLRWSWFRRATPAVTVDFRDGGAPGGAGGPGSAGAGGAARGWWPGRGAGGTGGTAAVRGPTVHGAAAHQ